MVKATKLRLNSGRILQIKCHRMQRQGSYRTQCFYINMSIYAKFKFRIKTPRVCCDTFSATGMMTVLGFNSCVPRICKIFIIVIVRLTVYFGSSCTNFISNVIKFIFSHLLWTATDLSLFITFVITFKPVENCMVDFYLMKLLLIHIWPTLRIEICN